MTSKTVLVAAHQLKGGKSEKSESIVVNPGDEITPAVAKKLGLGKDEIAALQAKGAINEVSARLAAEDAGAGAAELEAKLAAETKRANDAEARAAAAEAKVAQIEAASGVAPKAGNRA